MNLERFLRYLRECKFTRIWKGRELEDFYEFVRTQAIPNGGFLLSLPILEKGGIVWVFYPIKDMQIGNARLNLSFEGPEVYVPEDEASREVPKERKGYPVWRYQND